MIEQKPSYSDRLRTRDRREKNSSARKLIALGLFILYNVVCMIASIFYRLYYIGQYREVDKNFLEYSNVFGFWQLTGNWHKANESIFFRKVELKPPSLEIGICRGDISALHFWLLRRICAKIIQSERRICVEYKGCIKSMRIHEHQAG
ncbi:MAG: hypothetical protein JRJ42_03565, partial [Deltaproteobacteria bacterium]|nr:hypothetical protein [Deltaproteobacteria bacterium]